MSDKNYDFSKIEDFSENTQRVRRNLMIFSCITLIYVASGATITKLNILGTEIGNTHPLTVPVILILLTFYHLAHFSWLTLEHYRYNLLALSRIGQKGVHGNVGEIDTSYDKWNLYLWWRLVYEDYNSRLERAKSAIDKNLEFFEEYTKNQNYPDDFRNSIYEKIRTIESDFKGIKIICERLQEIKPSLAKFNNGYKNYSTISRYKWYLIETGLPILLGILSVILIFCKLSQTIFHC